MSAKTTAQPISAPIDSGTGRAATLSPMASGRLSTRRRRARMPSGLTTGAAARARRSAKRVRGERGRDDDGLQAQGDGDVGAGRPQRRRRDDRHRLEPRGGGLRADGAEHHGDRAAQRRASRRCTGRRRRRA